MAEIKETGKILEDACFSCYSGESCIGYEKRTVIKQKSKCGEWRASSSKIQIKLLSYFEIMRYGFPVELEVQYTETLSDKGNLCDFHVEITSGGQPMKYFGMINQNSYGKENVQMRIDSFGKNQMLNFSVPQVKKTEREKRKEGQVNYVKNLKNTLTEESEDENSADILTLQGTYGMEYLLQKNRLIPGDTRVFLRFEPTISCFLKVQMECFSEEIVLFPDGKQISLFPVKIHSEMVVTPDEKGQGDMAAEEEMIWIDGEGVIWKRYVPLMKMTYWRCSWEDVLQKFQPKRESEKKSVSEVMEKEEPFSDVMEKTWDFGMQMSVPILNFDAESWAAEDNSEQKTYRLYAAEENLVDFQSVFDDAEFQTGKIGKDEKEKNFIDITVYRSDGRGRKDFISSPPEEKDKAANHYIQTDMDKIKEIASGILPEEVEQEVLAREIENFVHKYIIHKEGSRGFITAAEVAETRCGDCTEHAVFFAALARARNIPTRVVLGMVLVPEERKFIWHMWNECYIKGRWIPFDATISQGFIGVDHIRVNAGALDQSDLAWMLYSVAQIMGKIEIEIR
ncbi:MAG: transglutaminase-like domain-containing protein [Planctomycetia bacterium]|nr:transglutaminase-like domain-containing protein [Planctomycetia bacterium]